MRAKIVNAVDNSIMFLAQAFLLVKTVCGIVPVSQYPLVKNWWILFAAERGRLVDFVRTQ